MSVKKSGTSLLVDIEGVVNGDQQFPKLDFKGIKSIVFNFEKVDAINSIGVKMWIAYLQDIPSNIAIKYSHCRKVVVDQMNMVTNFKPSYVKVESFYVPYHCPKCLASTPILYEVGKHYEKGSKINHPKEALCGTCVVGCQMDAIEAKYFHFLNR